LIIGFAQYANFQVYLGLDRNASISAFENSADQHLAAFSRKMIGWHLEKDKKTLLFAVSTNTGPISLVNL
jgi:hypothetical protein